MLPNLFRIGPIEVHSYGTLLMLGFVAGILLTSREARRLKLSSELAIDLGTWTLVAGVVFARLTFVVMNWADFAPRPVEMLYIWREGGLSFHGGLFGGVGATLLLAHRRPLSFWTMADMATPGLALGYGIARFGCFLNGCCFGRPTSLLWGVEFPVFPDSALSTGPSHPTQIYSALASFAILGILLWARTRLPARGQLFLLYLAIYSVARSGIEVLRKDYTAWTLIDGITQAQAASAVILVLAVIGIITMGRRGSRPGSSPADRAAQ